MKNSQKIKLLKIMELLRQETDEQHHIPRVELCRRMEEQCVPCATSTITRDIAALIEYGYEVMNCQLGHQLGYYVAERGFSAPN